MANCKKCGEPIKWAKTEEGRFIPMEKSTDVKELLMVVDYEENDKGWKTPIVRSMRLYEAHRNHCKAAKDDWQPHQSQPQAQVSVPAPSPPAGGGFNFGRQDGAPKFEDDDLPF